MRNVGVASVLFICACTDPEVVDEQPGGRRIVARVKAAVYTNVAGAPPVAGAPVAFVDPDGTGKIIYTDADGIARGEVVAGGSVTALVPLVPDNPPYLSTVLGVQDRDEIALGIAPVEGLPPASGTPECSNVSFVARYMNVDPANVHGIYMMRSAGGVGGVQTAGSTTPTAPITELAVTGPGATRVGIETSLKGPVAGYQQWMGDAIDGCATSYELDLAKHMLPWVGDPSLDVEEGIVRVPIDGVGGGDYLQVGVGYQRGDGYVHWHVISPHAGDVLLPELPDELADLMPQSGDQPAGAAAQLVDDDAIKGYDEARRNASGGAIGVRSRQSTDRVRISYRILL